MRLSAIPTEVGIWEVFYSPLDAGFRRHDERNPREGIAWLR